MYYIYHIPGVKIGCSTQPKQRVEKQGYNSFEILETHNDIDIASEREIQLQKQYGYKVDRMLYKECVNRRPKWTKSQSDKGRATMIKNGFFNEWYKKGNASRIKSVAKYDLNDNLIEIYNSISDAARSINREGNTSVICACCNNKKGRKSYMGYKWKWIISLQ
jgi:hypothetical protein